MRNPSAALLWLALGAVVAASRLTSPVDGDELAADPAGAADPVVDGGDPLLVDLADTLSDDERAALIASLPADARLNSEWAADEQVWRVPAESVTPQLIERLSTDPRVEHLEEDAVLSLFDGDLSVDRTVDLTVDPATVGDTTAAPGPLEPNDPLYPFQWNFDQIDVAQAWKTSRGTGVVVAVIDTGVSSVDVPTRNVRGVRDLAGTAFVPGYDFVGDSTDASDLHGHGTHVAGTIAQSTNNGYGVAGIAPAAAIMPLRVLDASGRGSTGDIADAIRFAARNGAHVINMSLGGPLPSRVLSDAIQYARSRGVVVIAAAGNSATDRPSYPAAYEGVIAVAATQFDRTATFYSNFGSYIDIAAPGGNVRVDQNDDGRPDGVLQETLARGDASQHEFALYMGTSMASPHVAGVAALIRSTGITDVARIEQILLSTADAAPPAQDPIRHGAGIVNAGAATTAALTGPPVERVAWATLLPVALLAGAGGMKRRRGLGVGFVAAAAAVMLAVPVAGVSASLFGLGPAVAEAFGLLRGLTANALLASVAPAIGLYAVAGGLKGATSRGALIGAIVGIGGLLAMSAVTPTRDVLLVPGSGVLDQIWLGVNALATFWIARTALRPTA